MAEERIGVASMLPDREQIDVLQYGRGFAALFVCLYHSNILVELFFSYPAGGQIFQAGHSGVEFFFVLSGFIIFHAHYEDIGVPRAIGGFFSNARYAFYRFFG